MDPQQVGVAAKPVQGKVSLLSLWGKCGGALALLMVLKEVYCLITADHKYSVVLILVTYGTISVGLVVLHNSIHLLPKYRQ